MSDRCYWTMAELGRLGANFADQMDADKRDGGA